MEEPNKKIEVVKIPNASEKISLMIADSLELHQQAMRLLNIGAPNFELQQQMTDLERFQNKTRSLTRVIWCQKELIRNASALVYHKQGDESQDYKDLRETSHFLDYAEQQIIKAEQSKTTDDDFQIKIIDNEGNEKIRLTQNYYDLRTDLEETFEKIYRIMLKNGLLSEIIQQNQKRAKLDGF